MRSDSAASWLDIHRKRVRPRLTRKQQKLAKRQARVDALIRSLDDHKKKPVNKIHPPEKRNVPDRS